MLRLSKQEYAKYIRSPAWSAVKQRYRASNLPQTCVVCGSKRVELHHRTYIRLGCEKLTDLIPLCQPHHAEAHQIRGRVDAERVQRKKKAIGDSPAQATATAKQLAWIRQLGGTPRAEMTNREARKMAQRLQRRRAAEREQIASGSSPPAV